MVTKSIIKSNNTTSKADTTNLPVIKYAIHTNTTV
jgi:hypothetical protein